MSSVAAAPPAAAPRSERVDRWWVEPLLVVLVLTGFSIYALWAALQNANYYAAPYLSPFYSPCLDDQLRARDAAADRLVVEPLAGLPDPRRPARVPGHLLLLPQAPTTARSSGRRRPAPSRTPRTSYSGETRFPFILQNLHRYFFWLSLVVLAFLWWDAIWRSASRTASASGLGTLVLMANAVLLSLYSFSCHSCRYLCGGYLDSFEEAPIRYLLWRITQPPERAPRLFAWISLFGVDDRRCCTCAWWRWASSRT